MPHDVFVSHSSKDKVFADAMVASLEARGVRCWVAPRDILAGENWANSILKAIESSRLMILVFSGNANDSPHIRREVERAVHWEIPVAPVRVENAVPKEDLEYFLSASHWMDAITPPFSAHMEKLADQVKALLHMPVAQKAEATGPAAQTTVPARSTDAGKLKLLAFVLALAAVGIICVVIFRRDANKLVTQKDQVIQKDTVVHQDTRVGALLGKVGDLYVSGDHSGEIYEVDPESGAILAKIHGKGAMPGIRFGPDGNLYAIDGDHWCLDEYDGSSGAWIRHVTTALQDPYGLTIADNLFYVCNSLPDRVDAYDTDGKLVHSIACTPPAGSSLTAESTALPLATIVSNDKKLLVCFRSGEVISAYGLDGKPNGTFGGRNNLGENFGMAYGPNANLYLSCASANAVVELDGKTGEHVATFSGGGLDSPRGIAIGPNGKLYVANGGANTISVFDSITSKPITVITGFVGIYDLTFKPPK